MPLYGYRPTPIARGDKKAFALAHKEFEKGMKQDNILFISLGISVVLLIVFSCVYL
jgi:hypothetical protein